MPTFTASQLKRVGISVFEAAGVPNSEAKRVTDSLVEANLVGHDSHGVIRILQYVENIRKGKIKLGVKIEVVRETPSTALIDGHWGFGQVIAEKGMKIAIEKAKGTSMSSVGVFHCNHIGRLGEYSMMAAERDMIGAVVCNSEPKGGLTAPYGGATRRLGTNPLSVAVPAKKMNHFLLDFATSIVAEGKVRVKRYRGERVPAGWILDKNGLPTNNPEDFYQGGALLPFGGHKGYALSLLIDIFGGILTGAGCPSTEGYERGNGTFMMAIDISSFMPIEEFKEKVDDLLRAVKGTPTAPGFDEVLIPGEPEFKTKEKRLRKGIYVSDETWRKLGKVAQELGLDFEKILK